MSDASITVLAAVYAAVAAAVNPTPVYSDVPEGTAFPYVVIGDNTAVADDTKTDGGQKHSVTVYAFSSQESRKPCLEAIAAIHGALHRATLSLSGHAWIDCVYTESKAQLVQTDVGGLWAGEITFEILTEPT